jgi:5-methylcytosine-specific restriction protein A
MSDIAAVHATLVEGVAGLCSVSSADERIAALGACESLTRRLEYLSIELIAGLERDGVFAERGYSRAAVAVADLLGFGRVLAARRVRVAEQVCTRVDLDGSLLPARLAATATVFATGEVSVRHVEVIADALSSPEAGRLAPETWAGVEEQLAGYASLYPPRELASLARDLLTLLDQDGPEPDHGDPPQPDELHLTRNPAGGGGRIKGRLDAPTLDAVATALDALFKPTASKPCAEDPRTLPERQADALGEVCRHALDHGEVGTTGGERPHLNVTISLDELERRARGALLDFGGQLHPTDLRTLCCDARVVPIVMGGYGQPLDVGRAMRTVPTYLRRAVIARDRGCAFPSCDRPPSRAEIHHIIPWELGGTTEINDLVALCVCHHRLLHHPGWVVRIRDGLPESVPPRWVDPTQQPRRRPAR